MCGASLGQPGPRYAETSTSDLPLLTDSNAVCLFGITGFDIVSADKLVLNSGKLKWNSELPRDLRGSAEIYGTVLQRKLGFANGMLDNPPEIVWPESVYVAHQCIHPRSCGTWQRGRRRAFCRVGLPTQAEALC